MAFAVAALSLAGCGNSFCDKHTCIGNFDNGHGYIVQCADGEWSHSGGESGACSDHGGETGVTPSGSGQTTQNPSFPSRPSPPSPPSPSPSSTGAGRGSDFCSTHDCIPSFASGNGYIVQCGDGTWSHSGGESGACSDHRGETGVTASDSGQTTTHEPTPPPTASTPTIVSTPTAPPATTVPPLPDSHPALTGPSSGSSGPYSLTITSLTADHSLDLAGYGEPTPQFGINFTASCQQPADAAVTWTIKAGNEPGDETVATCLEGSFGSIPQTLSVKGCGTHTLAASPVEVGAPGPTVEPIRIAFKTC